MPFLVSVIITMKVPQLALFELWHLYCHLQEDKPIQGWCAFLGNVSVTICYHKKLASWKFNESKSNVRSEVK